MSPTSHCYFDYRQSLKCADSPPCCPAPPQCDAHAPSLVGFQRSARDTTAKVVKMCCRYCLFVLCRETGHHMWHILHPRPHRCLYLVVPQSAQVFLGPCAGTTSRARGTPCCRWRWCTASTRSPRRPPPSSTRSSTSTSLFWRRRAIRGTRKSALQSARGTVVMPCQKMLPLPRTGARMLLFAASAPSLPGARCARAAQLPANSTVYLRRLLVLTNVSPERIAAQQRIASSAALLAC